jgi:hypothetical protein
MLLIFSVAIFAGDGDEGPVFDNAKAQEMYTLTDGFLTDRAGDFGNSFDQGAYMTDLENILSTIGAEESLSNFSPSTYVPGIEGKVSEMDGVFDGYNQAGNLKEEYLKETANFFMKEYAKDMQNGVEGITTQQYVNDMDVLKQSYIDQLDALNSPPPDNSDSIGFNPSNYLDRATGETRRKAKFDFYWGGAGDHWLNYDMVSLMQAFGGAFSGTGSASVAQADFQYLQDLWPQSAEAYMMNTAYNNGQYTINNSETGENQGSWVLNEYGMPASDGEYDPAEFQNVTTTTVVAGRYNNRQWGYQDGTYDIASITTNGTRYVIQENFYTSPLVLDMDNDGSIQASNGKWLPHKYEGCKMAEFDMRGDDFIEITEWAGPDDGLLIVYNNQKDVNANDLFGNAGGFANGYEKLSLLDANGDKQISGDELQTLSVWQDKNGNAKAERSEVTPVQDLGITSISVRYDNDLVSYFIQNGEKKKLFDWYPCMYVVKKTR